MRPPFRPIGLYNREMQSGIKAQPETTSSHPRTRFARRHLDLEHGQSVFFMKDRCLNLIVKREVQSLAKALSLLDQVQVEAPSVI